ncbi:hypothetical protein D9758_008081 [Tetrapyrgos nigripes]|uniref:Amino acid transporter n=1 Tax=Tetrapyrgos nigripes TaxID=182062 RepID=A0A8H5LPR2_9AGAR|nr:hypothetical protein D9758_008081 [Tetrapyrgos nigripes]
MVWGWTFSSFFLLTVGLAMAECASMAPTSGGLYYWTFTFSSPKWRCFLSWIVGYANTISNIASIASVDWGCAVQIMAAISIGTDLTFQATNAQTFGLFCAILVSHGLINSLNPRVVANLQYFFVVINLSLTAAIIIALPAATPKNLMNSAKFAFGGFVNMSTWPDAFAFILSFLTPMWTMGTFDGPVHISEEATNASVAVPYAIIWTTVSGLILGWGMNISLAFCMGTDVVSIVESPVGHPLAAILFNSFGRRGVLAVWSMVIFVLSVLELPPASSCFHLMDQSYRYSIGVAQVTVSSRQIFAFSRDGGLPLSRWVYHVNAKLRIPLRAVWFTVLLSIALVTLSFAGPNAINAVFALVITGQYTAYTVPFLARYLGGQQIQEGPISYGKMSLPITIVAVTWMCVMSVIVMFPANPAPGVSGMNYTVVVHGGVLGLATLYYFFPKYGGRYWFRGPVVTVSSSELENVTSDLEKKVPEHVAEATPADEGLKD